MSAARGELLVLLQWAVASRSTPARVRSALVRFLEKAAYVRVDDLEVVAVMVRGLASGESTVKDVEGAVSVARFFAGWDQVHP